MHSTSLNAKLTSLFKTKGLKKHTWEDGYTSEEVNETCQLLEEFFQDMNIPVSFIMLWDDSFNSLYPTGNSSLWIRKEHQGVLVYREINPPFLGSSNLIPFLAEIISFHNNKGHFEKITFTNYDKFNGISMPDK